MALNQQRVGQGNGERRIMVRLDDQRVGEGGKQAIEARNMAGVFEQPAVLGGGAADQTQDVIEMA